MEKFKKIFESYESPRILDIATGGGTFVGMISEVCSNFSEIIGIDLIERAIEAANKNFNDERIKFKVMDINKMTFEKHSFDIVCLSNSIHHMENATDSIEKMLEMLKPEGILLFNEMYSDSENEKQLTHTYMHHFWAKIDRSMGVVHKETMKRQEIIDLLNGVARCKVKESWTLDHGEEQVLTEDDYKWLKGSLVKSLERVKEHEDFDAFTKTSNELQERLEDIGFLSASQLLSIVEVKK